MASKKNKHTSKLAISFKKNKRLFNGECKTVVDVVSSLTRLPCYLWIKLSTSEQELYRKKSRFFRHISNYKTIQKNSLINKGLTGKFNPIIIKLMLSDHSYIEK
ncbi:MAG: terminase small subunit [Arsenophonus sp. NC-PG7-MAG3]